MQYTGEECGLCTRSITGRNRDEVTLINSEGNEEMRRVCTYCFALFNYLTGSESSNVHVQEAFANVLNAILQTRNHNVYKGIVAPEYDANDVAQPAKEYKLVPALNKPSQHSAPRASTGYVPDWMPKEELALLQNPYKPQPLETASKPKESIVAGSYTANVLQAGNFVACAACEKEARPGKKYCEDWTNSETHDGKDE